MRLKNFEHNAIVSTVKLLDNDATIYLFGSRVDDSKKGGDIDPLVLSSRLTSNDKRTIKMRLYELLEEQKIDLLIAADDSNPFVKLALSSCHKIIFTIYIVMLQCCHDKRIDQQTISAHSTAVEREATSALCGNGSFGSWTRRHHFDIPGDRGFAANHNNGMQRAS